MKALQGEMTLTRLQLMDLCIDDHWQAFEEKVPYLKMRLDMMLDVKGAYDIIIGHMGGGVRKDPEVDGVVQVSLMTLEVAVGTEQLIRWLDTEPLPTLCAAVGAFCARNDWIVERMVDETEYLASFLMLFSTCKQTIYRDRNDPEWSLDLVKLVEDTRDIGYEMGLDEEAVIELCDRNSTVLMDMADREMTEDPHGLQDLETEGVA